MLKFKLFVKFCYALYDCQLCDLGHNELKHFDTVWQIVVRRVWGLLPRTYSVLLLFIKHGKGFFDAVISRFYNFAVNCCYSSNTHVLFIARNARCSSLSLFGKIDPSANVRVRSINCKFTCKFAV